MKNKYKQKNIDMCIRLIARHDYTALEEFYKEFSNPIYRFSLMLLHDSLLAEDAMQNTFVKIMANAKSYSPGTNPRAWIFAIARNVCMDLYNKKVPIVEDTVLHSFSDEYAIDTLIDSITVREAIQKLTEIEKEMLCAIFRNDLMEKVRYLFLLIQLQTEHYIFLMSRRTVFHQRIRLC